MCVCGSIKLRIPFRSLEKRVSKIILQLKVDMLRFHLVLQFCTAG